MFRARNTNSWILLAVANIFFAVTLHAQDKTVAIDIQTALERALKYSPQLQSSSLDVELARIDRYLAKTAFYPTVGYHNQYLYTQGNGTPEGVFVGNNGVHEYTSQGVVHQEVFAPGRLAEYRRSIAVEAVAKAQKDVLEQGIVTTVFRNYYNIVVSKRHLANARMNLEEAEHFLEITKRLESGGEAAHADVVKAQLNLQDTERMLQDAQFSIEKDKIGLAILIFPDFTADFTVVDDLDSAPPLAEFSRIQTLANKTNPNLKAAQAMLAREKYGVSIARSGYLPTFSLDYMYGIDSHQFAVRDAEGFQRLGSSVQATVDIPVFNWWKTKSSVRQAEIKQKQAQLDLILAQRELTSNLHSSYLEARSALSQLDVLKRSLDLAEESLHLTNLRYEAGESTVLEVVDAQSALVQARNACDDGLLRYRLALATIQTLTGNYQDGKP